MGRRIFSRIFSPDLFSSFLWEKVPRKILQENPRQNPPKFIQQKSLTHFCRGSGPTLPRGWAPSALVGNGQEVCFGPSRPYPGRNARDQDGTRTGRDGPPQDLDGSETLHICTRHGTWAGPGRPPPFRAAPWPASAEFALRAFQGCSWNILQLRLGVFSRAGVTSNICKIPTIAQL